MKTTHDSGCAVPDNDTVMSFDPAVAGLRLKCLEQDAHIADLRSEISRINNVIDVLTDRLHDDEKMIDRQNDEIRQLKEQLTKTRTGKTLAERILHSFLTETNARSVRSSELRQIFGISSRPQIVLAMRRAAELSDCVTTTKFCCATGSELALIKTENKGRIKRRNKCDGV